MKVPKKLIVFSSVLVVLAVVGGVGYKVIKPLSQPVQGTLVVTPIVNTTDKPVAYKLSQGSIVSFEYPDSFVEQTVKPSDKIGLESHTFVSSNLTTVMLNTVVLNFPSNKLDDDPSYALRKTRPNQYTLKTVQIKNEPVVIATGLQDSTRTAFWVHQGKLFTVTLSGLITDVEATDKAYQHLLDSVIWKSSTKP